MTKKVLTPLEERFFSKIKKIRSGCWKWTGAKGTNGYGYIGLGRRSDKVKTAHRVSFEIHFGAPPKGKLICHKCSNRWCVNPQHLFAGTYRENLLQAYKEGAR